MKLSIALLAILLLTSVIATSSVFGLSPEAESQGRMLRRRCGRRHRFRRIRVHRHVCRPHRLHFHVHRPVRIHVHRPVRIHVHRPVRIPLIRRHGCIGRPIHASPYTIVREEKFALRTHHGTFARAHPGGQGARIDVQTSIGAWEQFTLLYLSNGKVALRTLHNTFVRTHPGRRQGVRVDLQTQIGPWETYDLIRNADGTVSFRSIHGTYLRVHPGGTGATIDTQTYIGTWERFNLVGATPVARPQPPVTRPPPVRSDPKPVNPYTIVREEKFALKTHHGTFHSALPEQRKGRSPNSPQHLRPNPPWRPLCQSRRSDLHWSLGDLRLDQKR